MSVQVTEGARRGLPHCQQCMSQCMCHQQSKSLCSPGCHLQGLGCCPCKLQHTKQQGSSNKLRVRTATGCGCGCDASKECGGGKPKPFVSLAVIEGWSRWGLCGRPRLWHVLHPLLAHQPVTALQLGTVHADTKEPTTTKPLRQVPGEAGGQDNQPGGGQTKRDEGTLSNVLSW